MQISFPLSGALSAVRSAANRSRPHREPHPRLAAAGLLLLGGLLVFAPMLEGGTTHLAVMMIRLVILLLLGVVVSVAIRSGHVPFPRPGVGPPVLVFLAMAAVSTVRSPYSHQSLQWWLVLAGYAALLYFVVFFITRWNHVWGALALVVGVGLFESGAALAQAWWLGAARPAGTFFNPNFLAGYLGAVALVVLGILCYAKRPWTRPAARAVRVLGTGSGIAMLALLLAGLMSTGSRGAALAFSVGVAGVLWLRFGVKGAAVLALVLCAGFIVPNPVLDRAKAEQARNPVAYARWQMWRQALRVSAEHPLGVGLGLYQYVSPRYPVATDGGIARYGKIARTPHNEYLQMAAETGPAAPVVFLWGIVLVMKAAADALRRRLTRAQRGALVGVAGGTVALLAHAALDSTLHVPALAILLVLYAGVLLCAGRLEARPPEPPRATIARRRRLWAGLGVIAIAVLGSVVLRMGVAWLAYEAGTRAQSQRDIPSAIAHFQRAAGLDPGKALYHSALAAARFRAYSADREPADGRAALHHIRTAVSLNPMDGRLYGLLGHVHHSLQAAPPRAQEPAARGASLRAAARAYARAAELEPYVPFHHLALGALYLELGDAEGAAAAVRQAVTLEPNFLSARAWLAERALGSGDRVRASRELREITERRRRYAGWPKDDYEARLLAVSTPRLERLAAAL